MTARPGHKPQAYRATLGILLGVHFLASTMGHAAKEEPINLFKVEDSSRFPDARLLVGAKRHGVIELIPGALDRLKEQATGQANNPDALEISLDLSGGKQFLIKVGGVNPLEGDRFTLSGKLDGDPFSMVILAYYEGIISASISGSKGENYLLEQLQDNFYLVSEPLPGNRFKCGVDPGFMALQRRLNQGQVAAEKPRRKIQKQSGQPGENEVQRGYKLLGSTATASNPVTVDVMIVYTKEAREDAGSIKKMKNKIDLCITTANEIFEESKVYVKCNLVHSVEVKYTHGKDLDQDLDRLTYKSDGYLDTIHKLRSDHGADLVSLFVINDKEKEYAGLAWMPDEKNSFIESWGFNANQSNEWGLTRIFTHEIGHNFGCHHDRETIEEYGNSTSTIYNHSYGYHFKKSNRWHSTIMAYEKDIQIPRISNPNVKYQGKATGTKETHSEPCYNAKTINQTASLVADYKHKIDKPYINKHPVAGVLNHGKSFTLSVTARGRNLKYKWFKDGRSLYRYNSSYTINNAQDWHEGWYKVIVSNGGGSTESNEVYLEFNEPPIILSSEPPEDTTFTPNETFTAKVTCTDPDGSIKSVTFHETIITANDRNNWKATSDGNVTASTSFKMPGASGNYTVPITVTDNHGGEASLTIHISSLPEIPIITRQPNGGVFNSGDPVELSVIAEGEGNLAYRWYKDSSPMSKTSSYLSIWNASESDAGRYKVKVSNSAGSTWSEEVTLRWNQPPVVESTNPVAYSEVKYLSSVYPEITVSDPDPGGSIASVRIYVEGIWSETFYPSDRDNWTKLAGKKARVDYGPITMAHRGNSYIDYDILDNDGGKTNYRFWFVGVDEVEVPPEIVTEPKSQTVNEGKEVILSVFASGTPTLYYQWKKNGRIYGAKSKKIYLKLTDVSEADSGNYSVVVSNGKGSVESKQARLTVNPVVKAPKFVLQPVDQDVNQGDTATFNVEVSGTGPFTYRWKRDGAFMKPLQEKPELLIRNVSIGDVGSYQVVVKNSVGRVVSKVAYLTLNQPPSILYQDEDQVVAKGEPAKFRIVASGTEPMTYSWLKDGKKIQGANQSTYSIAKVQAHHEGAYMAVVQNVAGEDGSYPMDLSIILPPSILVHPGDQVVDTGQDVKLSVKASGTEPISYLWQRGEQFVGFERTLSLLEIEMNQAGQYRVIVRNAAGEVASNFATLIIRPPVEAPSVRVQPLPRIVSSGDPVTFVVQAEGTAPLLYRWQKDGAFITSNSEEPLLALENVKREDAGSYTVRVSNKAGFTWSEAVTLVVDPEAPHIVTQPVARSIVKGAAFVVTVEAIGRGELSYQWKKDGKNIPGAQGHAYSIETVQFEDEGEYKVLVSNDSGVAKSHGAYLEVRDPSAAYITQRLYSQVVTEGDPVEFSVEVSGIEPITYQWLLNETILVQAKTATYRITKAGFKDQGDYQVLVQNAHGGDSSGTFKLQVQPRPVAPNITSQPEAQSIKKGETATLTVKVTGEEPFTYQWKKDRVPIPDSNNPVYSIEQAQPEDSGIYRVEVTNKYGYVISKPVRLDVIDLDTAKVTSITINGLDSSSLAVWPGETVELKINATGKLPITYWWEFNDVTIEGVTEQTYKVNSFKPGDAGKYTGGASNDNGSNTTFIILTRRNPGFSSVSLNPGNTMTLTIDARIGWLVTLERSGDLVTWEEAEKFIHEGDPREIPSNTQGKLFYRLKVE